MKSIVVPFLLLAAFSAMADARPVYRCVTGPADVAYQDTPCATGTSAADPGLLHDPSTPVPSLFDLEAASPGDWEIGYASPRRTRAVQEGLAIATRVQARQKPLDERDAARHAENRQRCASALRIAELCGKNSGTFYCDAKGFQPIAPGERVKSAFAGSRDRYTMESCALQAARSH
ncbi:MAG TPA: hypothetical protein VGA00_02100 [Acidiferrobacterales bacterium]